MMSIVYKQVKFHLIFWTYLFLSLIPLAIVIVAQLFNLNKIYICLTSLVTRSWGKTAIFGTGSTITIYNKENIPTNKNVCYVCNHQSNFDIPTILGSVKHEIGFVAKSNLIFFPIVGLWMKFMGCIFITRSNLKESIKTIQEEIKTIPKGRPILVFPEGTRAKSNSIGVFQPGTLRSVGKTKGIDIIPMTIIDSYKTFEEVHYVTNANIKLHFHKAISTDSLNEDTIKSLPETLKNIIEGPLL